MAVAPVIDFFQHFPLGEYLRSTLPQRYPRSTAQRHKVEMALKYRFGRWPNLAYCGAGAYPCGSIAGTPGYMCAQQLIREMALN